LEGGWKQFPFIRENIIPPAVKYLVCHVLLAVEQAQSDLKAVNMDITVEDDRPPSPQLLSAPVPRGVQSARARGCPDESSSRDFHIGGFAGGASLAEPEPNSPSSFAHKPPTVSIRQEAYASDRDFFGSSPKETLKIQAIAGHVIRSFWNKMAEKMRNDDQQNILIQDLLDFHDKAAAILSVAESLEPIS
jgi:hypothetical protein